MNAEQRARALRLAECLRIADCTGAKQAADLLRELAAEPRKRTEQDAFEDWLEKERPSGDVTEVQRQWESSSELAEFLDEQREQAEPERVPLTQEQVATVMSTFYSDVDHAEMMFAADLEKCRAVERAHGIGCGK